MTERTEPANLGEIKREIAKMMYRCNGLISEDAARVWAEDLLKENLTPGDLELAGQRLPAFIEAVDRGNMRGRISITDIVRLASRARTERKERALAAVKQ